MAQPAVLGLPLTVLLGNGLIGGNRLFLQLGELHPQLLIFACLFIALPLQRLHALGHQLELQACGIVHLLSVLHIVILRLVHVGHQQHGS